MPSRTPLSPNDELTKEQERHLHGESVKLIPINLTQRHYHYWMKHLDELGREFNAVYHKTKLNDRERAIAQKPGQKLLLGMRKSSGHLHGELLSCGIEVDIPARHLIDKMNITGTANKKEVEVVIINGFDLGFSRGSTYDEAILAGEKLGYELANAEIGFEYILQGLALNLLADQINIAMKPIELKSVLPDKTIEVIMRIERDTKAIYAIGYEVKSRQMFGANTRWIFVRPQKSDDK